ncbi:hypothetical protein HMPREF3039_00337 [Akkermansia sp. KLE1798]|nr:hypothetical protein HMPREF3039_00337 [Akkermansia sp. KLE1798]
MWKAAHMGAKEGKIRKRSAHANQFHDERKIELNHHFSFH